MKQKKLEKLKRIKMELLYEKIKAIVASSVASEKKKK